MKRNLPVIGGCTMVATLVIILLVGRNNMRPDASPANVPIVTDQSVKIIFQPSDPLWTATHSVTPTNSPPATATPRKTN